MGHKDHDNSTSNFSSGTSNFDFTFDVVGLNYIYVTLENEVTGCIDSVGFRIDVQGIPEINNVFTPNGDDVNDYFDFGEYAMQEISVEIFNRWGNKVYSWEGIDGGWNGKTSSGSEASVGTYFYIIRATGEDDQEYLKKGSFSLLR